MTGDFPFVIFIFLIIFHFSFADSTWKCNTSSATSKYRTGSGSDRTQVAWSFKIRTIHEHLRTNS